MEEIRPWYVEEKEFGYGIYDTETNRWVRTWNSCCWDSKGGAKKSFFHHYRVKIDTQKRFIIKKL